MRKRLILLALTSLCALTSVGCSATATSNLGTTPPGATPSASPSKR